MAFKTREERSVICISSIHLHLTILFQVLACTGIISGAQVKRLSRSLIAEPLAFQGLPLKLRDILFFGIILARRAKRNDMDGRYFPAVQLCYITKMYHLREMALCNKIASGMISLAQTGVMPCLLAASGNTPIPSNRLPSVIVIPDFLPVWLSLTYIALSGGEWC